MNTYDIASNRHALAVLSDRHKIQYVRALWRGVLDALTRWIEASRSGNPRLVEARLAELIFYRSKWLAVSGEFEAEMEDAIDAGIEGMGPVPSRGPITSDMR